MSIIPPPGTPVPQTSQPPKGPPVKLKMRPDLTFDRMTYQGVEYWVVKEPLGQKYFQFPPHVFYLLQELDGDKTIEELQDGYHEKFAPKRITRQDLQQLLTRFHQDSLVTSNLPGQGEELLKRGRKNKMMERVGTFSNVLAIRYKGFDPERILNWLLPYTWWIFTRFMVWLTMICAAIALLSVVMNWTVFQSKLPGFEAFFDPKQWYLFGIVLCVTKICHEFGHGLACKRLGGECHEIGFMLLVLTPCLYCNVSDSWRLPNKWHRAAIGAAGIYVEVMLATIATFVWWFVQPGMVQDICLRVMLVSSISTILFNGNPLLRFDGYYILSDILEIPNLNQKSTKALTTLMGRHWLGLEIPDDQLMPSNRPWAFAMFTVAAFCYRWFIMFSIIILLTKMLEPYNLESIGIGIALFSLVSMIGMPSYKLFKYMSVPGRMHQVKKVRFFVGLSCALILIGLILFVPFPHTLRCNMIVMPREIETIWVKESGMLESFDVEPGELVSAGQALAHLKNLDIEMAIVEAKGQLVEKEAELKLEVARRNLAAASPNDPTKAIMSEIMKIKRTLASLEEKAERLVLKSTIDGTVLATPYEHNGSRSDETRVGMRPLLYGQHENVSAQRGQRFCEIADLSRWYAVVVLTEHQVKFAKLGQKAKLKLYSEPGKVYKSQVESIGETDFSIDREDYEPSQQAAMAGNTESRPPDPVVEMVAHYQRAEFQYFARVPLTGMDSSPKIGMGGQARLTTGYRSLGYRIWWWFNQNFRA